MIAYIRAVAWGLGLAMALGGFMADLHQAVGLWPGKRGKWIAVSVLGLAMTCWAWLP